MSSVLAGRGGTGRSIGAQAPVGVQGSEVVERLVVVDPSRWARRRPSGRIVSGSAPACPLASAPAEDRRRVAAVRRDEELVDELALAAGVGHPEPVGGGPRGRNGTDAGRLDLLGNACRGVAVPRGAQSTRGDHGARRSDAHPEETTHQRRTFATTSAIACRTP